MFAEYNCQRNTVRASSDAIPCPLLTPSPSSLKPGAIQMHEDLAKMSKREQELSEALAEIYATISNDAHPLLVRDPQIRTASPVPGLQKTIETVTADPRETEGDEILVLSAAISSMQIGGKQYHGDTVSAEVRLISFFDLLQ